MTIHNHGPCGSLGFIHEGEQVKVCDGEPETANCPVQAITQQALIHYSAQVCYEKQQKSIQVKTEIPFPSKKICDSEENI
jgi:hypothetical protein